MRLTCEDARRLDAAAAQTMSQLRVSISGPSAIAAVRRRLSAIKPAEPGEAGEVVLSLRLDPAGSGTDVADCDVDGAPAAGRRRADAFGEGRREVDVRLREQAACTPAARGALRSIEGVLDVELI